MVQLHTDQEKNFVCVYRSIAKNKLTHLEKRYPCVSLVYRTKNYLKERVL